MAADGEQNITIEARQEPSLKYVGFVYVIFQKVTVLIASLYEFAKENSGPLKPGVDSVEGTVKTVVGPVFHKIEGKPAELLVFVDSKVDELLGVVKQYLPDKAYTAVEDVQNRGVYESVREYYVKYEPYAEELSYKAWQTALKMPVFPQVVHMAAPAALYGVDKFNGLVITLKENKVPFADYVPFLPKEKIERAVNMEPVKQG